MYSENNGSGQTSSADYYFDPNGNLVYTAKYLRGRGYCCGNGCRHCPYLPRHRKGNRRVG